MNEPVLRVIDPGLSATIQDQGRHGWRRFGVPTGGAMDLHAALMANRLIGNPPWAPVVELLVQGARFEVLDDVWLALTGADGNASHPQWRAVRLRSGDRLAFPHNQRGVWSYLAVEGGFVARHWLDSASALVPAGIGRLLKPGDIVFRDGSEGRFEMPPGVRARFTPPGDRRDYDHPPKLRLFRGPQWEFFSDRARQALTAKTWTIAAQSNRVGYRLQGEPLEVPRLELISEPVLVGTIQVPENGQLLAIMRDGPTIGGYPKIALLHPDDINWLAQCRAGQSIQFVIQPDD